MMMVMQSQSTEEILNTYIDLNRMMMIKETTRSFGCYNNLSIYLEIFICYYVCNKCLEKCIHPGSFRNIVFIKAYEKKWEVVSFNIVIAEECEECNISQ